MTSHANATPTPIVLCADDFGISAGVDRAIIELAGKGRLSAVSCMSLGPAWPADAPALKKCGVAVGLHVTLTYLPPLTPELGVKCELEVGIRSWLRLLDKKLVEQEIRAQFARFTEVWGGPPDFIDGHQSVHVLPFIRDVILRLRGEYAPKAWVRNICDFSAVMESWKNAPLAVMGFYFRRMLDARGIAFNKRMRGPYDYSKPADFGALMEKWCAAPALIYCHPGFPDAELAKHDKVLEPRQREYDFLNSDRFSAWLGKKITLGGRP